MRFNSRSSFLRLRLVVSAANALALAAGVIGAAGAQVIPGPLKVTDSGPSVSPSGFAIKGITSYSSDSGVFGYGTAQLNGTGIDGVTAYVESSQSVGVVGWAASSTGNASFGVYGYSGSGNGVYGQTNNAGVASIYGNNTVGGTAIYGFSAGQAVLGISSATNGVVGITQTTNDNGMQSGVLGVDNTNEAGANNYGVAGISLNLGGGTGVYGSGSIGIQGEGINAPFPVGVEGSGFNGVYGIGNGGLSGAGVIGQSIGGGTGVYGIASGGGTGVTGVAFNSGPGPGTGAAGGIFSSEGTADALDASGSGVGSASFGIATGEGGAFFGGSGNASHPVLLTEETMAGTDYFAAINATSSVPAPQESFAIQGGSANYSGYAVPNYGSDVQISGDLYVQGAVYQLCSSSGGSFPVTSPHGHCYTSVSPAVRTTSSRGGEVTAYSTLASVPAIEDFGEAQLVNGEASVSIESTFASTIDRSRSYLVFVTPEGDCNGLYVTGKSAGGFIVRELRNGHSSLAFQYRIVGHPYANNAARLAPVAPANVHQPSAVFASSQFVRPRRFKVPILPPGIARNGGASRRGPRLGSLPKRLSPPNISTAFRR